MHDRSLFQEGESDEQLDGESTDQRFRNASKVVSLKEIVQINWKHLKGQNQMLSKCKRFKNADHIPFVVRISFFQTL